MTGAEFKAWLKAQPWIRPIRRGQQALKARTSGHPPWAKVLAKDRVAWDAARHTSQEGPRILIATSVGAHFAATQIESMLAAALTLRGARVDLLLCDGVLPACMACDSQWYPDPLELVERGPASQLCGHCFGPAAAKLAALGLTVHRYGELLDEDAADRAATLEAGLAREELEAFREDGVALGQHARAGALRFFARGTLDAEPQGEAVLRRFLRAAMLTRWAVRRLLDREQYTCAVFHHGIYVPQGVIGDVARQQGVRVVNWNPAYRRSCFIFSHGESYHHTLLTEPVDSWQDLEWNEVREKQIRDYLKSRWTGSEDWIWFHEKPELDVGAVVDALGIDPSVPCVGLLTNVFWDAQLHYPSSALPDMLTWLLATIEHFAKRSDLQLLIRIHPAEIRGTLPSRQRMADEISRVFPRLPANVFVIPPESNVSTYAAMSVCDSVIIYGTKTGVELTSMGMPVIVAGEAWIRGKGLTRDARSEREYFELLEQLPVGRKLDPETTRRALKFAYHFFFRRMIPLDFTEPQKGWPPYRVDLQDLSPLHPGQSSGLDTICNGILEGTPFVHSS